MKKLIVLALLIAQQAWAITVSTLSLPSPGFFTEVTVPISGVSGIPVAGQTLTLEIPFPDGKFLRLLPDIYSFGAVVIFFTDVPPAPTNYPTGTVAPLDSSLNPLAELPAGAGIIVDTGLFVGLNINGPVVDHFDIYGLKYTINLPAESSSIVGANLKLVAQGPALIAPLTIPDTGSAAVLLGCGLIGLFCAAQRRAANSEVPA